MGRETLSITLRFGADGLLKTVSARGHAGHAAAGSNVVCAAVTALLRTAYEVLTTYGEITVQGGAPVPGLLDFTITECKSGGIEKLTTIADVLVLGIRRMQRDNPAIIGLVIEKE